MKRRPSNTIKPCRCPTCREDVFTLAKRLAETGLIVFGVIGGMVAFWTWFKSEEEKEAGC